MSNSESTGKVGKAVRVVRDHPILAGFALFIGAVAITRTVTRRNSMFDIELPEATEVREADLIDYDALATIRDNDGPLQDSTQANGPGDDTNGDPISKEIKP